MTTRLPDSLTLRPMTPDDLPQVLTLEQAAYTSPWPEKAYRQELANPRAWLDVAEYSRQLVGYSGMWHFVDEVHLGTLVTHQAVRRRGIGEFLLLNIIHRAINLAATAVTLEVRASNSPAIQLYQKYQFREVGERKKYYPDKENAIIMTVPGIAAPNYQDFLASRQEALFKHLQISWQLA